jgi:GNAT superfamily N-acetyltransferase
VTDGAPFVVRRATGDDAGLLARHRAEMWREMGRLTDEVEPDVIRDAVAFFARAVPDGTFRGWLAAPAAHPDEIVAGAGFLLRPIIPTIRLRAGRAVSTTAPQALVVNVYTAPAWRRRGLGRLLMQHVLDGARAAGASSVVLHASDAGRPLYEGMGFVGTNEMRFSGES